MYISFVIPCFHSELTVEGVIAEIHSKMLERSDISYEIVAVNDCSPDGVFGVLKKLAESDSRLKIVDLAKNSGRPAALLAGYSIADGDVIVNLDDDGQCPMDRIWDLMKPLDEGYDISMAKYPVKKESAFKRFGSKVNSLMAQYLIGKPKDLYVSNFSAVKRFVVNEMVKYDNPYPYMSGLMLRTTSRICNVSMEERERTAGVGHYTFMKSLKLWVNGFTAFSVQPLRVSTFVGFACAAIGALVGIFTVINKLVHPDIQAGYSSLMAVLLFIGGMIMMMLGMIGEYVGRIYICINKSPQYVIRKTVNCGEDNATRVKKG